MSEFASIEEAVKEFGAGRAIVVVDESKSILPGVAIEVKNLEYGATRNLVTDENGRYRALNLPPGVYGVSADAGRPTAPAGPEAPPRVFSCARPTAGPARHGVSDPAPPRPSSETSISSRSPSTPSTTVADDASAYLATFASYSEQTK